MPPCHTLDLPPPLVLPAAGPTAAGGAAAGAPAAAVPAAVVAAAAAGAPVTAAGAAALLSCATAAPAGFAAAAAMPDAMRAAPAAPSAMPAAASSSSARCSGPISASAMAWCPESEGCTHLRDHSRRSRRSTARSALLSTAGDGAETIVARSCGFTSGAGAGLASSQLLRHAVGAAHASCWHTRCIPPLMLLRSSTRSLSRDAKKKKNTLRKGTTRFDRKETTRQLTRLRNSTRSRGPWAPPRGRWEESGWAPPCPPAADETQ